MAIVEPQEEPLPLSTDELEEAAEANLRANVRTLSRLSNLTFVEFANALGFKKSALGQRLVSDGTKKPTKFSAAELVRISAYCGVDPAALLSDEPTFLATLGAALGTPPGTRTRNLVVHGNSHSPSTISAA
jgi:hypothetical protein